VTRISAKGDLYLGLSLVLVGRLVLLVVVLEEVLLLVDDVVVVGAEKADEELLVLVLVAVVDAAEVMVDEAPEVVRVPVPVYGNWTLKLGSLVLSVIRRA